MGVLAYQRVGVVQTHQAFRTRSRRPDFAPSSKTPGGYVGQAVLRGFGRRIVRHNNESSLLEFRLHRCNLRREYAA
jgi:hypothetical protein